MIDRILLSIVLFTHKDLMPNEEKEVDLDAYVEARNEGATEQEAFELSRQKQNIEEEEND